MNDKDDIPDLPPDLAELDRELSAISIEIRSSFEPELRAELEEAAREVPARPELATRRYLIAAGIGALLLASLSAPARASLARWVQWVDDDPVEETIDLPAVVAIPPVRFEPGPLDFSGEPSFEFRWDDLVVTPPPVASRVPTGTLMGESHAPRFDREAARLAILERYPRDLMIARVGATVDLRFWVGSDGSVDQVQLLKGSGSRELDAVVRDVIENLPFTAARNLGLPLGTWVSFPVSFEPEDLRPGVDPDAIDEVTPPDGVDLSLPADLAPGSYFTPPPLLFQAQQLLGESLGQEGESGGRWGGQLEALLTAVPPVGERPNTWRREATMALEQAMAVHPRNPAPALALVRIQQSMGLRSGARRLIGEGLARTSLDERVSPSLVAELQYELGMVIQEEFRRLVDLGRLPSTSLDGVLCSAASRSAKRTRFVGIEDLLSLNMVCPEELAGVLAGDFETTTTGLESARADMMRAFNAAVDAHPAHAPANVEILLDLADQGRWDDLLDRSRAFEWEAEGHAHGRLMTGLALARLGRAEEALQSFKLAMESLEASEVEALRDFSILLTAERADQLKSLLPEEQLRAASGFWERLDPILTTPVNEGTVEHLARASYALLRFGSTDADPARVWIRYGRPVVVRTFAAGSDTRVEFWNYGVGPDLTFRREASSFGLDLTGGSATYVDDLLAEFPHVYNRPPAMRSVRSLTGQVRRVGMVEGKVELAITIEVPAELVAGSDAELAMSIFLLDSHGHRVSSERLQVSGVEQTLRAQSMASPDAKQVIVELYNPAAAVVAILREPVPVAVVAGGEVEPSGRLPIR